VFPLEEPIVVDDSKTMNNLWVRTYSYDPTLTPHGKTLFVSMLTTTNCQYWDSLRRDDMNTYKAEKDRVAQAVINALDRRLGDIKKNVEMIDVSTPATVMRYTNNWKGSFEGWILSPKIGLKEMKKTLPGLNDFFMVGQWVQPGGGVPTGLLSGRNITQIICKQDGKTFTTRPA